MNTRSLQTLILSMTLASLPLIAGCHSDENDHYGNTTDSEMMISEYANVVTAAQAKPELSILVEAVIAAGLAGTLSDADATYTVFAPTNAAFATLLEALGKTKEELFADKELLTNVLTYHVISDTSVKAAHIPFGQQIQMTNGNSLKIVKNEDKVQIIDTQGNKSNITATDVITDNGIVHLVDKVILPESKNLVEIASNNPIFSILVEAIGSAGLADTLANTENLTVFAPTNDAFVKLLGELNMTKEALLADKALLKAVLTYHVVGDRVYSSEVTAGDVPTLQGQTFSFDENKSITDARNRKSTLVATDVNASNGVIHVIDTVILPE